MASSEQRFPQRSAQGTAGGRRSLRAFFGIGLVGLVAVAASCGSSGETVTVTAGGDAGPATEQPGTTPGHAKEALAKLYGADETAAQRVEQTVDATYTMADYMTAVLTSVHGYWADLFAQNGLTDPSVNYYWMAPGESVVTGCDAAPTTDQDAFYCPADDTIYISQQFAIDMWSGADGGAGGDFAVATVIAHEFGHNVQAELGIDTPAGEQPTVQELQADCLAGAWMNAAEYQGQLEEGDVEEAILASQAAGSYDDTAPNFHGTPEQRVAALLTGYQTGDPGSC